MLLAQARGRHARSRPGVFGAHMQVALINDGPVTFWLESQQLTRRELHRPGITCGRQLVVQRQMAYH